MHCTSAILAITMCSAVAYAAQATPPNPALPPSVPQGTSPQDGQAWSLKHADEFFKADSNGDGRLSTEERTSYDAMIAASLLKNHLVVPPVQTTAPGSNLPAPTAQPTIRPVPPQPPPKPLDGPGAIPLPDPRTPAELQPNAMKPAVAPATASLPATGIPPTDALQP